MTLAEINQQLEDISSVYSGKIKELAAVEALYNLRFWDLIIHSGLGNQAAREAEANLICQEEGILEPVQILRADVKALFHKKECLITISANLRALGYGREEVSHESN